MQIINGFIGNDPDIFYNSNGHRCKEVSELNFRNYLLFVGDNLSLGLDKPIEKTYPYIISKNLATDYYNLSVFNGGIDATKHNLFSWLYHNPQPRAIIIGFEFLNAILKSDKNLRKLESVDYSNDIVQDVIDYGNSVGFFNGRNELFNWLLNSITSVPVYQIYLKDRENLLNDKIVNIPYEDDIFNHSLIADKFLSIYNKRTATIKP